MWKSEFVKCQIPNGRINNRGLLKLLCCYLFDSCVLCFNISGSKDMVTDVGEFALKVT